MFTARLEDEPGPKNPPEPAAPDNLSAVFEIAAGAWKYASGYKYSQLLGAAVEAMERRDVASEEEEEYDSAEEEGSFSPSEDEAEAAEVVEEAASEDAAGLQADADEAEAVLLTEGVEPCTACVSETDCTKVSQATQKGF